MKAIKKHLALALLAITGVFLTQSCSYDINHDYSCFFNANSILDDDIEIRVNLDNRETAEMIIPGYDEHIPVNIQGLGPFLEELFAPKFSDSRYLICHVRKEYRHLVRLVVIPDDAYYTSRVLRCFNDWIYSHDTPYNLESNFDINRSYFNKLVAKRKKAGDYPPADWIALYDNHKECYDYIISLWDGCDEDDVDDEDDEDFIASPFEAFMNNPTMIRDMMTHYMETTINTRSNLRCLNTIYRTKLKKGRFLYLTEDTSDSYPLIISNTAAVDTEIERVEDTLAFCPSILIPPKKEKDLNRTKLRLSFFMVTPWQYVRVFHENKLVMDDKLRNTLNYYDSLLSKSVPRTATEFPENLEGIIVY